MRKKLKNLLLFASLGILFISCTPYLYVPNTLNMPLAGNQGEVKAVVYSGTGGFGLQGSYALTGNVVLIADAAYGGSQSSTSTIGTSLFTDSIQNFIGDIGGGYYSKINESTRFDVLGGIGYGSTISHTQSIGTSLGINDNRLKGGFPQFFVQGDIGGVNENLEFGFGLRIKGLAPTGSYIVKSDDTSASFYQIYNKQLGGIAVFAEPSAYVAYGFENVKWNFSLGYSGRLSGQNIDAAYGNLYQNFFITTGITLNLFRKLD